MRTIIIAALLLLAFLSAGAAAPEKPENLALKAQASSEYSVQYLAKFAVDGVIPEGLAHADDLLPPPLDARRSPAHGHARRAARSGESVVRVKLRTSTERIV